MTLQLLRIFFILFLKIREDFVFQLLAFYFIFRKYGKNPALSCYPSIFFSNLREDLPAQLLAYFFQ